MKFILLNTICIITINALLYLAINVHQLFLYILTIFIFCLLSFVFKKIMSSRVIDNLDHKNNDEVVNNESAEDHPIIRSARERLGK